MTNKKLTILSNDAVFNGFFKVRLMQFSHSLYRGGVTSNVNREVFCRGDAVVVLLFDLTLQKVVLVEQCRAGALQNAVASNDINQAWLLEPVAGMIDKGETAVQAAIRETKEETGLNISDVEYVTHFYPSPGGCDEILHLYASEVDSRLINRHAGLESEDEDIRVVVLSFSEAKEMLYKGQFNVASTYLALQWFFHQKLSN